MFLQFNHFCLCSESNLLNERFNVGDVSIHFVVLGQFLASLFYYGSNWHLPWTKRSSEREQLRAEFWELIAWQTTDVYSPSRESEQSEWNRWTENNKTTTTTKTTSTHQFLFNSSCKLLNRSSKLAHTHKETPPKKIQNNNNNNKKWNKQTKNKRRKKQKSPSTVSIFNCYSTYVCMCLLFYKVAREINKVAASVS